VSSIIQGDALSELQKLAERSVNLIYCDPPFNTGDVQRMTRTRDYGSIVSVNEYNDEMQHDAYLYWLRTLLLESRRILTSNGSIFIHADWREIHYIKVLMDELFGRQCFINEIIWTWDYGGRAKHYLSRKHNTILWYAMSNVNYVFNYDALDRVPYMAESLQTPERIARGKPVTDSWWCTIVPTQGKERTGYPSQKPVKIVRRIVAMASKVGDVVLDMCAGSGTLGAAALELDREFILVDNNEQAIRIMQQRFAAKQDITWTIDERVNTNNNIPTDVSR
jgi:site-specific DNA-methyltransferase (adenine-specific)